MKVVRNRMAEFFNQHYKASRMSLVVQSQHSLDAAETLGHGHVPGLGQDLEQQNLKFERCSTKIPKQENRTLFSNSKNF